MCHTYLVNKLDIKETKAFYIAMCNTHHLKTHYQISEIKHYGVAIQNLL